MILYISGGMSNLPNLNFHNFGEVARLLRRANHLVLNPAENWGGRKDIGRAVCMRLDIHQVLCAEGLAMLDGWPASKGACLEHEIAVQIGLDIRPWRDWL